ncbi:hypothetical protein IWZ03DRAFT_187663 [Phyllosticta citriasiana]|uniref:Uncharacterized protein n=1 Tax=Phyllosticta citriasiana TaxID=595635 RepID=A0ABR1KLI4_9PEZI
MEKKGLLHTAPAYSAPTSNIALHRCSASRRRRRTQSRSFLVTHARTPFTCRAHLHNPGTAPVVLGRRQMDFGSPSTYLSTILHYLALSRNHLRTNDWIFSRALLCWTYLSPSVLSLRILFSSCGFFCRFASYPLCLADSLSLFLSFLVSSMLLLPSPPPVFPRCVVVVGGFILSSSSSSSSSISTFTSFVYSPYIHTHTHARTYARCGCHINSNNNCFHRSPARVPFCNRRIESVRSTDRGKRLKEPKIEPQKGRGRGDAVSRV